MYLRSLGILFLLWTSSLSFAGSTDRQLMAALTAKNEALTELVAKLERRIKDLEDVRVPNALQAANQAQTKAVEAKSAAEGAQRTADRGTATVIGASIEQLVAHHGGCSGSDFASPNCHAASHRFCKANGYASGLIVEFDGSSVAVSCFR